MFTGREFDQEIGLYYYRARYYDQATGRFLSEDPIGFDGGDSNFYRIICKRLYESERLSQGIIYGNNRKNQNIN
ncbi:RHS repeat-associated core domain-containing protein [Okeanomitos corallinicola]|uniref:RHS repeat-associated core domain-containing protein n=1 Tax=Okeanomitos corallinicola TaxID=3231550 RepID=UPI00338EDE31